jgi:hypothetical protein
VARNERRLWLDWPVTFGGVQIGAADTTRFDLNQDLSLASLGDRRFFDCQFFVKSTHNRGFHRFIGRMDSP